MPIKNTPGSLAEPPVSFTGNSTADFHYTPRPGALVTSVFTIPTQPGTVQVFLVDRAGAAYAAASAAAVLANALDSQQINFPIAGSGFVIRVRYTNNNNTAGTCRCFATDDKR